MELLSQSRTKPNLDQIRKIKVTLRQALKLSEEDTITVSKGAQSSSKQANSVTVIVSSSESLRAWRSVALIFRI